jgi:hypothetical protein
MATLSLRRLWTIYKRLAVEPGSSKREGRQLEKIQARPRRARPH